MLALANKNITSRGLTNIELIHSSVENLPLSPNTADCIISNCVLNLVPDAEKPNAIREAYRVLKPGGRLAISDLVQKKDMPDEIRQDAVSYVGCVAGAIDAERYKQLLTEAGFQGT
jgi:arsenite methyltransferase